MTTFILHGGYTSTPNENNKRYYSEIAKRIPKNGRILFVYFANEESKWKSLLENDKENFKKFGVKIDLLTPRSISPYILREIEAEKMVLVDEK